MESYPATNGSVSGVGVGVFPTEHHHHHLPLSVPVFTATACSSPYLDDSNSNNSLSEIFLDQYTEVDVSSEWLSSFVEECLSSAGNCLPPLPKLEQPKTATPSTTTTRTITPPKCAAAANDNSTCPNPQISDKITITHNKIQTHQHFAVPGKPRSQRKRRRPTTTTTTTDKNPLLRWAECLYPETQPHQQLGFSDHPPLLEQAYWLADSELISLPRNDVKTLEDGGDYENSNKLNNKKKKMKKEDNRLEELDEEEFGNENSEGTGWEQQQQTRRCSHCQAQKTPQWRAGPLGPKTLCNACGVRYFKSGRLLPEYRPAKSPTFVSDKHSNSHKKVLQMRKAHLAPPSSTSPLG